MWYGNSLRTAQSDHRWAARRSLTYSDVIAATTAAVRVFEARNIPICAVGGLACKLFGNPRTPNDADLLLLNTTMGQEELKRILVNADSQFYLIPAKNPLDTYKVLWFRTSSDVRVKVDLLQPGIMSIPNFSSSEIEYKSTQATTYSSTRARIPVAPFGLVLLLKLQAWEQHRDSSEYRFQQKQHTDSRDIDVLLPLAASSNAKFDSLPEEFLQEARRRVISYTRTFPSSDEGWKQLGFKTFKVQVAPRSSIPRTSTSVNSPATRIYGRTSSLLTVEDEISRLLERMQVSSATRPVARDYDQYD